MRPAQIVNVRIPSRLDDMRSDPDWMGSSGAAGACHANAMISHCVRGDAFPPGSARHGREWEKRSSVIGIPAGKTTNLHALF